MEDLEKWLRAIPPELKLDFTSFHHRISREAVSTFLHYYQCVNMTGRPILYRVCKRRLEALAAGTAPTTWQEGLSSSVVHVVSNSIAAARAATTVMDAASKHNLLGMSLCRLSRNVINKAQRPMDSWMASMPFRRHWC